MKKSKCFLFHKWNTNGNTRICNRCGKKQVYKMTIHSMGPHTSWNTEELTEQEKRDFLIKEILQ